MCFHIKYYCRHGWLILTTIIFAFVYSSCSDESQRNRVDALNDAAYHYHYISLDSTLVYANRAYKAADGYEDGRIEAMNNLAFVDIAKMYYVKAQNTLLRLKQQTDNKIEQLVANVQMMRLCQRESRNKDFYDYYWKAQRNLDNIRLDMHSLTKRQKQRVFYAETELSIVLSAYLYYVGQKEASIKALSTIDEDDDIQKDTTLLLNYFYNIGSGGFLHDGNAGDIAQKEFDYLVRCYFMAQRSRNIYWQANALQAMSEHLLDRSLRTKLIENPMLSVRSINVDNVNDTLIAGNFAQRSVELFQRYGDAYQTAGALRTLADCYFQIGDSYSAINCLDEALSRDTLINQSSQMISSIRERLSIFYSSIDDKSASDYNRNIYLDMYDNTRQDRELEARAEKLSRMSMKTDVMMMLLAVGIVAVIVLLMLFTRMRKRDENRFTAEQMLEPLDRWKERKLLDTQRKADRNEEILEEQQTQELLLDRNIRKNIEQRAKMSLVNSITPFIDRMLAEIRCLQTRQETPEVMEGRYDYILELTDKINEYNAVLTNWITLSKGELSLRIESFQLQSLFDIVAKGKASFRMKGIELQVDKTKAIVKADKTLTLFMINTIADNARKATPEGGRITIAARDEKDYVEVAVSDTGKGMYEEQLAEVFNHQPSATRQHGFGLMNCKGIIEKYRKTSALFSVCNITAESEKGRGTTFRFRLPHGIVRLFIGFMLLLNTFTTNAAVDVQKHIQMFADSTYFSNLKGHYERTLQYSDSARTYLNMYYKQLRPKGKDLMRSYDANTDDAAELKWFADSLPMNYNVILDVRNETAVAALALHDWELYHYNNNIYAQLYHEMSSDPTLLAYVSQMEKRSEAMNVAMVLLVIVLICMFPAYYLVYYRHKVYYRFLVDRLYAINRILPDDISDEEKLENIRRIWLSSNKYINGRKEASQLDDVVRQICKALEESISVSATQTEQIELAEDELNRLKYENDRLHINNNVLDNCFSTLKHETMYYPSRIRQLVTDDRQNVQTLSELTNYYKELYTLLSMQAQHQVEKVLRVNRNLTDYMLELLRKLSTDKTLMPIEEPVDAVYSRYIFEMPALQLTDEETVHLFTPLTCNLSCLIIRQIVREAGEMTNHRGCGVMAEHRPEGCTNVIITLSRNIWKISK